jgi:predicted patatin/cPLA2 family phospholipase
MRARVSQVQATLWDAWRAGRSWRWRLHRCWSRQRTWLIRCCESFWIALGPGVGPWFGRIRTGSVWRSRAAGCGARCPPACASYWRRRVWCRRLIGSTAYRRALNGWATAVGQAALGVTHYDDAVSFGVINRMRALLGRPVIDFDVLFEELIGSRKPLSFDHLRGGPEFRALTTSLDSYSLRVLADFSGLGELRQAVRASAALPRLGGEPPVFRGEPMADGGLIEPIPFRTALEEVGTHVLVLRSRPASYRKPALSEIGQSLALRDDPRLVELLKARAGAHNRQAGELEQGRAGCQQGARVLQIAVPDHVRLIGRLESNAERFTQAVRLGAQAMASAILGDEIDLCCQPVIYRTRPRPVSAPSAGRDARAMSASTSAAEASA